MTALVSLDTYVHAGPKKRKVVGILISSITSKLPILEPCISLAPFVSNAIVRFAYALALSLSVLMNITPSSPSIEDLVVDMKDKPAALEHARNKHSHRG